jgi:hypothetical protein
VEAEPLVAAIERRQQHVRAREVAQHRRRAAALQDRVAEVAAEPVENRGALQELDPAAGDREQELIPDVVDDEAVVAGEAGDRPAQVGNLTERQPGEVERRRPALGPLDQRLELLRAQLEAQPGEQLAAFGRRHHQVLAAELGQAAVGPHPAQRQRRLGSGREDQLRAGADLAGDRGDGGHRGRRVEPLEIVKDEDEGRLAAGQRLAEARQYGSLHVRVGVPEGVFNLGGHRLDRLQHRDNRADQQRRVVVLIAEDDRGERPRVARLPRSAPTCRSRTGP